MICFGLAWPVNIAKSLKTRSAKGKSVFFLLVVELGYICGITHKLLYSRDLVLALYLLNFAMVLIDIFLYFRNLRFDQAREKRAS